MGQRSKGKQRMNPEKKVVNIERASERKPVDMKTFIQLWNSATSVDDARKRVQSEYPHMSDTQVTTQAATYRKGFRVALQKLVDAGRITAEQAEAKNLQTFRKRSVDYDACVADMLGLDI
tara:strand:+ start:292 stop:651 length:360 start_codon:yes stop_codon:yes gene_type:complete